MKDIVKQELAVGNVVAFNPPRYKGLLLGKIVKFTPKMVTVEYTLHYGALATATIYPNDLALIPDDIAIMYFLSKKPAQVIDL